MNDLIQRLRTRLQTGHHITDMNPTTRFDRYPPATRDAIDTAEKALGFSFPPLLRQIYTEISNGGFGPGYGLLGLEGGARDDLGSSVIDGYLLSRQHHYADQPTWIWPEYVLPVCHWGCGIYSCLDCAQIEAPVLLFDPNDLDEHHRWSDVFYPQMASFERWMTLWVNGVDLWRLFHQY